MTLLGKLHPLLVHLPIAWLILTWAMEIVATKRQELVALGPWLVNLTALSFVPAITTGLLRLTHFAEEEADLGEALLHRNVILASFAVLLVAVVVRFVHRRSFIGVPRRSYLALLTAAVLLLTVGAHLGGELVYGDDYLPW